MPYGMKNFVVAAYDVTENALVALYFACCEKEEKSGVKHEVPIRRIQQPRRQRQLPQSVQSGNLLASLGQQPLGDVIPSVDSHMDAARLLVDVRSHNGRLRQRCTQRLRRLVIRKHIE